MAEHLRASLAIAALDMALKAREVVAQALVHHSDRGILGGFKWLSQHSRCWPIEATGQAPLRAFSNRVSFGAGN